jgi:hypothetical protein
MSAPLESPEFENLFVGNTHDDDGAVIDSFFVETDTAALPVTERIAPAKLIKPKAATRLVAQTLTMYIDSDVQRIMSEDLSRSTCRIKVYSLNDTPASITRQDYVIINDERGKVSNGTSGINVVIHHNQSADFDGHTGALYVKTSPLLTAFIEITGYGIVE